MTIKSGRMLPGYSTNSIADLAPLDALPILADLGYRSIAITPDRHLLDPRSDAFETEIDRWRTAVSANGMACVIETGARHLLDPLVKHEPTLVSASAEARGRRITFLESAIRLARRLGGRCVSLWSGAARDSADEATLWNRLVAALGPVLEHAAGQGIVVGFEPEPGMFIDTLARYEELLDRTGRPDHLALTLDIGHMECMGERPASAILAAWTGRIVNVHVDDMLPCRHEHIPPGAGDVEFGPIFERLQRSGYAGGLHVELPRQSHRWLETARASAEFFRRAGVHAPRIHAHASSTADTSK